MCETGKRCHEGGSCVERVDRLRKHVWVLMIWVSILSLGLGASIALQFTTKNTDAMPGTHSQLTSYDPVQNNQDKHGLWWQKTNGDQQDTVIKIEDDGNYFLFLRVALQARKRGVNYTVAVKKAPSDDIVVMGHINGTASSTEFIARGVHLTEGTSLIVSCSPPARFDVENTFLGLIKF